MNTTTTTTQPERCTYVGKGKSNQGQRCTKLAGHRAGHVFDAELAVAEIGAAVTKALHSPETLAKVQAKLDAKAAAKAEAEVAAIEAQEAADIEREAAERQAERDYVRATYGPYAAELLANGWTVDSAINHVTGVCDLELCTGEHGTGWATAVATATRRPEVKVAALEAELARANQVVAETQAKLAEALAELPKPEVAEHHATYHQPHDVTTMATFIAECHQCTWRFVGSQADSTAARAEHEAEAADVVGRYYARR
jgi:hypothetical protein